MNRFTSWIQVQFWHIFPAFLFFWISFNSINLTEGLMQEKGAFGLYDWLTVFFAAAVVAKVLIFIDNLPFIDLFQKKPLIFNVLWKTTLYGSGSLIFRLILRQFHTTVLDWPAFWAIQLWYVMLFFIFVTFRDLIFIIGPKKVHALFFKEKK